jgi:hypothetical protein
MTGDILSAIDAKRKAYHAWLDSSWDDIIYEEYRGLNRIVKNMIRSAKAEYLTAQMSQFYDDPKKGWQRLNEELGRTNKSLYLDQLSTPEGIVTAPNEIAESINTHFANTGKKIADKFACVDTLPTLHSPRCSVDFDEVSFTADDVQKKILNYSGNYVGCLSSMPTVIFKRHASLLSFPLSKFFNLLISSGTYPTEWKTTTLTPLHKGGKKGVLDNLRPIGAIHFLPKLFDSMLNEVVWQHLRANSIISNEQFGFRRFNSTESALQKITSLISSALDNRHTAVLLSIDVSKAFDTIDHPILLHKLEHYGFRGAVLQFFSEYLINRRVCTRYAGIVSSSLPIINGVTQGSPLAGTLFLLYEDDFFHLGLKSVSTGFADDINQVTSHPSGDRALSDMAADLSTIFQWYSENKLLINKNKSKFMIISNSHTPTNIPLELSRISQVNELKILGLTLNHKLTYTEHTKIVLTTANAVVKKKIYIHLLWF